MALTELRKRFVEEYLKDLNATQAAIRAGYSAKTANEQAARLLANVSIQAEIQRRQKDRSKRTEITQDRVLQELASIGFAKGTDYASIADGCVEIKSTDTLTETQKAAITAIKETKDGVEIKLADKVKALELIGKHLGMFAGNADKAAPPQETNLFECLSEIAEKEDDAFDIPEVQFPPEDDNALVEESEV